MKVEDCALDRRVFLRLVSLGLGAAAVGSWTETAAAKPQPPESPTSSGTDALPAPGRYLFRGSTRRFLVVETTRLEALWAHSQYVRLVNCTVAYAGTDPFVLTQVEHAVVEAAIASGAAVADREAYFLEILAACTRIAPNELHARLAMLGASGVTAALLLAPHAPQAGQLRRWLAHHRA